MISSTYKHYRFCHLIPKLIYLLYTWINVLKSCIKIISTLKQSISWVYFRKPPSRTAKLRIYRNRIWPFSSLANEPRYEIYPHLAWKSDLHMHRKERGYVMALLLPRRVPCFPTCSISRTRMLTCYSSTLIQILKFLFFDFDLNLFKL